MTDDRCGGCKGTGLTVTKSRLCYDCQGTGKRKRVISKFSNCPDTEPIIECHCGKLPFKHVDKVHIDKSTEELIEQYKRLKKCACDETREE